MRWKITDCLCIQNLSCNTRYSIVQKLSNKQSAKVICRIDRLCTAYSMRQTSHMSIGKLIGCPHTFNYIVLSVKPVLTSCEHLAIVLAYQLQQYQFNLIENISIPGPAEALVRPNLMLRTIQSNTQASDNFTTASTIFYKIYYNVISLTCLKITRPLYLLLSFLHNS